MKFARAMSCALVLTMAAGAALAAPPAGRAAKPARRSVIDNTQLIDINNISMVVTNTGSFAFDKATGNAGLEFPKGTGKTAVFAAGLWVGAKVAGETRVAVAEFSDEFGPGSAAGGTPDDPDKAEYKVYKLDRFYSDLAARDAALGAYTAGAVPYGAPAVTVLPNDNLSIVGDQMCWAVYNDLDPADHTNRAGSTNPLGIEVQQTTFAFARQGALGNTVFIKYKFINRGTNVLTDMYVSQWSDPDLGGFTDDLVACDPALGLGYVYNANNADEQYGSSVPAVGYDFFKGPAGLQMTSFNKYINGTDPNTGQKSYNYMTGLDADGNAIIDPTTGMPTAFQVSGDPVTGSGWLDSNPADRRLMLSSGPFTMNPGDVQEVVTAIVIGQSTNRLASISLMKFYDTFAQAAFEADFDLPSPPTAPVVQATPRDGGVFLSWDTGAEVYDEAPYNFEGYVVYQGASIAGPWTRIATYDRVNGLTTVLDSDFNELQGLILPIGKAFGQDAGVRYSIELTQDQVLGGALLNGSTYYYSVNAYSVGVGQFPQVLESAFNVVSVIPQTPAAGTDWNSAAAATPVHIGNSTDVANVDIVDPDQVQDATYTVGFRPACGSCANTTWYVTRTTPTNATPDTVINNQTNYAANDQNPVFDGVRVQVVSFPPGELARVTYDDVGPNPPALAGAHVDLRFFDGGADYANLLFGSSIPEFSSGPNIEIRFTDGSPGQKAYRYLRCNCSPRTYLIQDFIDVPWTVWDIDSNTQLNAGWLENEPGTIDDMIWNPDETALGGRELIWPMSSAYTGVADPAFLPGGDPDFQDVLGAELPHWYAVWPIRVAAGAVIDAGDKISFTTSIPSNASDQFVFSTTAPNRLNASLARGEMARIKAVPNPYFTHSRYELNQFNRQVKFTHLPGQCTVRLFNLAGDLIRTLDKNDTSSQLIWDLETNRGLPVGSGIYIFHVDAPGVGTHVGKVAIFMEKERLSNF